MAYVAARGGERAIEQAERLFREGLGRLDAARVTAIAEALPHLVDRTMGEASLHAPELAALALAQSGGDVHEAVLLLRAWRTTQPRLAVAEPAAPDGGLVHRRISAAFKDVPGGQVLGPTLDYAHRILMTDVLDGRPLEPVPVEPAAAGTRERPSLAAWQQAQGLVAAPERDATPPEDIPDLTREPVMFPAPRAHRLQSLARAETGGVLALGYAAMRGHGPNHPTVNELRLSEVELRVRHPRGTAFSAGRVRVSQAEVANAGKGGALALGFCATLGWNEVKVIAGATLDLNMDGAAKGDPVEEEFVLYHTEPVESSGFCLHFKLPHHVTFQSALDALRGSAPPPPASEADAPASEERAPEEAS